MQGNGGTVSARHRRRACGEDGDVGPGLRRDRRGGHGDAGGIVRRRVRQRRHLRHGRHLDRRRADPRRPAVGVDRARARVRDADPRADGRRAHRSAPAAARSPRSTRPACCRSGPRAPAPTPGPICYGRGGTRPTITDANLVLGRLDPGAPAVGGPAGLAGARCAKRSSRQVGTPLGLDADGAAAAILRVANDQMAGAIRMVRLARGHDPRDFALFAFGGAGPLHAVALARELGDPEGPDAGAAGPHQCARLRGRRPAPRLRRAP